MLPSFMTCNGMRVVTCTLVLPRVGVWHADLTVDIDDDAEVPSGEVTLETEHRTWRATVRRGSEDRGVAKLRVVGGKGGMGNIVPPKSYRAAIARLPIADALSAAGEALADSADRGTLHRMLPFWTSPSATAGEIVARVCADLGVAWRMLDDGTVWVGPETWPAWETPADAMVTARWPDDGAVEVADETLSASPGMTFEGQRIGRVEHRISADGARTILFFDDRQTQTDTVRQTIARIARTATGCDYLAAYRARVVAQNADDTLEVELEDKRMPGMSHVPIRTFAPGITLRVKAGARVLIEFEGGDPQRPIATLFESGDIRELVIRAVERIEVSAAKVDLVSANGIPIARQGDIVLSGGKEPAPCLITLGAPGATGPAALGVEIPAIIRFATGSGPAAIPVPLAGVISSGNPNVRA